MPRKSKSPLEFETEEDLLEFIHRNMPDEYPSGMAQNFSTDWLKRGKAVIKPNKKV